VTRDSKERAKLKAKLRKIQQRLKEIELALKEMEESWDGYPTPFHHPKYSWKPGMPDTASRVWDHYNWLQQERMNLLVKSYALQRRLKEVRP
jgi:chaperonin cofactor prefoldin